MKNKITILLIVSSIVIFLDQLTKSLIVKHFPIGSEKVIWENFFDIVHVRNKGAAFGFLSNWQSEYRNIFFYLIFFIALAFLFHFLKKIPESQKLPQIFIALIFGGALGNLADRLFRGSVVDFLSFHWYDKWWAFEVFGKNFNIPLTWPSFNVADMSISVGVIFLILFSKRFNH